jgi:hypothetical protein
MHRIFETLQGGILFYPENQLNAFKSAFVKFQQQKDIKAALLPDISYASGQVRTLIWTRLLIRRDIPDSSQLLLSFFMMRLLHLREYSTISWLSPLPRGLCILDHSWI